MNRNQFFMTGIIIFLIGVQLRWVESYTLTAECTQFLAKRFFRPKKSKPVQQIPLLYVTETKKPVYRHKFKPPKWLGWMVLCTGGVFILHSLAMPKPSD